MGKDYYKILGVGKGANETELKKGMSCGSLIRKSCVAAAVAVTEITPAAAALTNLG